MDDNDRIGVCMVCGQRVSIRNKQQHVCRDVAVTPTPPPTIAPCECATLRTRLAAAEREREEAREALATFVRDETTARGALIAANEDYGDDAVTPADVVRRLIAQRDTERAAHDATQAALDAARAEAERMRGAVVAYLDANDTPMPDAMGDESEHDAWAARVHDAREAMRAALAPRDATPATSAVKCPACHGAGFVPGGAG